MVKPTYTIIFLNLFLYLNCLQSFTHIHICACVYTHTHTHTQYTKSRYKTFPTLLKTVLPQVNTYALKEPLIMDYLCLLFHFIYMDNMHCLHFVQYHACLIYPHIHIAMLYSHMKQKLILFHWRIAFHCMNIPQFIHSSIN